MSASLRGTNTHWLFKYQKEWLRWDLIAGLITAAVGIPKAMAHATIAGLPVQVGLYTVLVPMAIYAVVGTSRPLSMSTHHETGHPGGGRNRLRKDLSWTP